MAGLAGTLSAGGLTGGSTGGDGGLTGSWAGGLTGGLTSLDSGVGVGRGAEVDGVAAGEPGTLGFPFAASGPKSSLAATRRAPSCAT